MRRSWLVPLTGIAFIVLAIVGGIIQGEPPGADEPVQEIVDHYVDNDTAVMIGSAVIMVGLVLLIFFANHLRRVFEDAGERTLAAPILVGASIMAVGGAIDSMIAFALAEAAEDIEPSAVQALQALWDNDFLPIALGVIVLLLAAGLAIVRTGVLPKWLGWVALALVVVGPTPIGFVAFLGGGIWILIVSIMLAVRERRAATPPPTAPPPPAAAQ